jgi:hypothetical protein
MLKHAPLVAFTLAATALLTACAHQRQPQARCSGPLERINLMAPAGDADNSVELPAGSNDELPEEESAP